MSENGLMEGIEFTSWMSCDFADGVKRAWRDWKAGGEAEARSSRQSESAQHVRQSVSLTSRHDQRV